jgi:hypothetical protein
MKMVFLSTNRAHGVKLRSGVHTLANNDDNPTGGAIPVVLPLPATDEQTTALAEHLHLPWQMQGIRNGL